MDITQMKELIAQGKYDALESAYLEALEHEPTPELAEVLADLTKAEQNELAATLAGLTLESSSATGKDRLELAKAMLLAAPTCKPLRDESLRLYKEVYASSGELLAALLDASGLANAQSPRRAIRTLDVCLALREGDYLANRYDNRVLKAGKFNKVYGQFEAVDGQAKAHRLEPKQLADEFEVVPDTDFRVLTQHRPGELKTLIEDDPAAMLIGLCLSHGGSIDSGTLQDRLVPRHIPADQWSGWWSRARTAAKRSGQLSVEGRSPVIITYHAQGRSLEQEFAGQAAAAATPLAKLDLLQQYVRQARERKVATKDEFTGPILAALVQESISYIDRRPADALAAAVAVQAAAALGLSLPQPAPPGIDQVLGMIEQPAQAIAQLEDADLWRLAVDALTSRPDAATQLEALLPMTPVALLDDLARRLTELGRTSAVEQEVAAAYSEPLQRLEITLWLWKGPAVQPGNAPGRIELLARLLKAAVDLEHEWQAKSAHRKAVFQRIRSGLSAGDYAPFRQAAQNMSQAVAETVKRQIERASGVLAESVSATMMDILREHHIELFIKRDEVEPWLDESTIYTTQQAMDRQMAALKELDEVKIPANARAIGAAAEHGDLSENSEWKFALEERDMLRARHAKLQDELSRAKVIYPDAVPTDHIGVGSKAVLRRKSGGEAVELSFLGPWDSDVQRHIYSYQTTLARELMGKKAGETVTVRLDGSEDQYTIERIESAVSKTH